MVGTDDILGHRDVIARLWGALGREGLHHAYLFEGPSGIGKRLVALRLAMAANCTGDVPERPCGVCATCTRIAAGTHPDVIVLEPDPDRATPIIPVDAIRELVRAAQLHRYDARRRFVIVDPAEAMADPAANALLKTLEEPPPGTGFVLLADNPRKLLPTILSRCQRVRFRPVPEAEIAGFLRSRGLGDADTAARLAEGCPGRALELAEGGLAARRELRAAILDAIAGDLGGVFAFSTEHTRGGRADWTPGVEAILALVEDLVRDAAVAGSGADVPLRNPDLAPVVDAWADALWPSGVTAVERALDAAREDLVANVSGKLVLDALLTRLATELGRARKAR